MTAQVGLPHEGTVTEVAAPGTSVQVSLAFDPVLLWTTFTPVSVLALRVMVVAAIALPKRVPVSATTKTIAATRQVFRECILLLPLGMGLLYTVIAPWGQATRRVGLRGTRNRLTHVDPFA
jgi:hypothetical protein